MKRLEEFVIEKLKVSKENTISLDTNIYALSSHDEFNTEMLKDRFHPFRVECEFQHK